MYEIIDTRYDRVRCLERIVKDNDMGKGLGISNKWNGNELRRLALESIADFGGDEAIESLKGLISEPCVNEELKTYASKLLETLLSKRKDWELNKALIQGGIWANSQLVERVSNRTNSAISKSTDVSFQADKRLD